MGMDKTWQNGLGIIAPMYHPPSSPLASHFEPTIRKTMGQNACINKMEKRIAYIKNGQS